MQPVALHNVVKSFKNYKILIIGDVMLDNFVYGQVDRISPEGPIPILKYSHQKMMAGGAGNVAANIISLGGQAHLISCVGKDNKAEDLKNQLKAEHISAYLAKDEKRPTTEKTRYIARGQQLLRLDNELAMPISSDIEKELFEEVKQVIEDFDVILLSDYAKGVLTASFSQKIIALANQAGKPILVDPKGSDWQAYKKATLITPNIHEAAVITGYTAQNNKEAEDTACRLAKDYELKGLLLTRGPQGMSLYSGEDMRHLATEAAEVADVSGAGDTVVATFSLALAAGMDMTTAASIANTAAGIVVEKLGTATVSASELMQRTSQAIHQYEGELMAMDILLSRVENWKKRGFTIGFTNGCFDLLHAGHLHNFIEAKKECDRLIVAVNSDASVKRLKGESRPVQSLEDRARVLAHLREIDAVCMFEEDTPYDLIEKLQPDILIKGGDYKVEDIAGHDVVLAKGGRVVTIPLLEGFSTTATIAKIANKA